VQSLRGSSRSDLKRSMNWVLATCKSSKNQRLCKRFLSQLRSLFNDDYEDEDSPLVGAFECSSAYREAALECVLNFKCWSEKYPTIRQCLVKVKPDYTELVKCNVINQKVTECTDSECMFEKIIDLGECLISFLF
jgi:hypothetical protein